MTEIVIANPGSDLPFPTSLPEFMRLFPTDDRISMEGEVEAGVRWANNILVEIQGNHGRHLDPARRDALRAACSALSDFRSPSARAAAAATTEIVRRR
jgi:hypothetical protein